VTPSTDNAPMLVDAHVHLHPCFDVSVFLDSAREHFAAAARAMNRPEAMGCLMFSECVWHDAFAALADGSLMRDVPRWSICATDEPEALLAMHEGQAAMLIVAGRQIITAERLEVLALACGQRFADGEPASETCHRVLAADGLPVLPWAFGKWWGRRGRVVHELLDSPLAEHLFLGDNGNRPACAPSSSILQRGRQQGIPILPGSDPLPLTWQVHRAGSYGFFLDRSIPLNAPAAALRKLLQQRVQPPVFGRRASLMRFVRANIGLRWHKDKSQPTHHA